MGLGGLVGGLFKSKKGPQMEYSDFIPIVDEITGTETKTVVGPDGRKRIVTSRLPRSAEEQMLFDKAMKLQNEALGNIEKLSALDPFAVEEFKPFLNAFKSREERQLDEMIRTSDARRENALGKMGLRDSTSAAELRAASARDNMMARVDLNDRTRMLAEDLRSQAINRHQNLFGLGQGIYTNDLNRAMSNHNISNSLGALEGMNNIYNQKLNAFNNKKPGFGQQLLGTAATAAGYMLGGPMGAQVGSMVGGSLGGF